MSHAKRRRPPPGIQNELAKQPPTGAKWLKPTFRVSRGSFTEQDRKVIKLPDVYIAVLSVDPAADTATYEVLGSLASPSTIGREALATLLRQRGVKLD